LAGKIRNENAKWRMENGEYKMKIEELKDRRIEELKS
jgi:hypothetical protein